MEQIRKWAIYTLSHPLTQEIRYVGVTCRIKVRLYEHICKAKTERNHRACWIRSLLSQGIRPVLTVIEKDLEEEVWQDREKYWINFYRDMGLRLVNSTEGGEGTPGYAPSEETILKMKSAHSARPPAPPITEETRTRMREAQKKRFEWEQENGVSRKGRVRSDDWKRKQSEAHKGKPLSPEHRAALSRARKNVSEETRQKLREAILARPKEEREAWARNQKGVPKSEATKRKMSEAAKGRVSNCVVRTCQQLTVLGRT